MQPVQIPALNDMHVHWREPAMFGATVPPTAAVCATALVMPNVPPLTNLEQLRQIQAAYQQFVASYQGLYSQEVQALRVCWTLALTPDTTPELIAAAAELGVVACKLYPGQAGTTGGLGLARLTDVVPLLRPLAQAGLVLSIHAEAGPAVPLWTREQRSIGQLEQIRAAAPAELRIVIEHVSSRAMVDWITGFNDPNLAGTLTAHHLVMTQEDWAGNLSPLMRQLRGLAQPRPPRLYPHHFCLPVAKSEDDRRALNGALQSPRFFLGSDSAPHVPQHKQHNPCPGCFTAPCLAELLATHLSGLYYGTDTYWPDLLADFGVYRAEQFYRLTPPAPRRLLTLVPAPAPPAISWAPYEAFLEGVTLPWSVQRPRRD